MRLHVVGEPLHPFVILWASWQRTNFRWLVLFFVMSKHIRTSTERYSATLTPKVLGQGLLTVPRHGSLTILRIWRERIRSGREYISIDKFDKFGVVVTYVPEPTKILKPKIKGGLSEIYKMLFHFGLQLKWAHGQLQTSILMPLGKKSKPKVISIVYSWKRQSTNRNCYASRIILAWKFVLGKVEP